MTTNALHLFIQYYKDHIKGDEKGEAQIFLDRFFTALGYPDGLKGAGASCEYRVKSESKRSTSFADLVWKPRVLIEMKKRDEDLTIHLQQAFSYWAQLVPDRPQYVILCNFDEFWIYDFNKDIYQPQIRIQTTDLVTHRLAFSFLLPTPAKPLFEIDHRDITAEAAQKVAAAYKSMLARKAAPPEDILRYILQCIIAMFAEDVELLPDKIFTNIMEECNEVANNLTKGIEKVAISYDLISGLFRAMNDEGITPAGKYKGGLRWPDLIAYRHSAPAPCCRRVGKAARRSEPVIAAEEWGGLQAPGVVPAQGRDDKTPQRSTNAFSITKWPGVLWLPSRKPRPSNIWRNSSSMPGLPHIMMRSVSISSGGWWMSLNNCSDVIRSVMRPRLRNGSRVTVG